MKRLFRFCAVAVAVAALVSCGGGSLESKTKKYDAVGEMTDGLAVVVLDGECGVINEVGEVVVKPQYERIFPFVNGYAPVLKNSLLGFINTKGELVVEAKYDLVYNFLETGLAVVKKGFHYGMIDGKGKEVVEVKFYEITQFENGFATIGIRVGNGGADSLRYGIINDKGEFVVNCNFAYLGTFVNGLAPMRIQDYVGEYGYVNYKGETVLPVQYFNAKNFEGDVARVAFNVNTNWGLINKKGDVILDKVYSIREFNSGYAAIKTAIFSSNDKPTAGYTDVAGNKIVLYDDAGDFHEGFAAVKVRGDNYKLRRKGMDTVYWTVVDSTFEQITDLKFDLINDYQNGLFKVFKRGEGYGCLNTQGELVIPCVYTKIEFLDGNVRCTANGSRSHFTYNGQKL